MLPQPRSHYGLPPSSPIFKPPGPHQIHQTSPHWPLHATNASINTQTTSSKLTLYDLYDRQVPYEQAWKWQKALVDHVATQTHTSNTSGAAILLQHPSVYTLGAGATEEHLRFPTNNPPHPLYRTERGGEVTYHGPGQLVLYPIINLKNFKTDLHWYLRSLEEVVMHTLSAVSDLQGERISGLTGVWVDGKKVAAVGVRANRWVTYHGLALNVVTELSPFSHIVPCGISDRAVGSVSGLLLQKEQENDPFVTEAELVELYSSREFERGLIEEYRWGLREGIEEVFGVQFERIVEGEEAITELERLKHEMSCDMGRVTM